MVPMRTVLNNGKLVQVRRMRLDRHLRQIRHAVELVGEEQAVPVEGCFLIEIVVHVNLRRVAFGEGQCRHRYRSVDCDGASWFVAEGYGRISNVQVITDGRLTECCG